MVSQDIKKIIKDLYLLGERQFGKETAARVIIQKKLAQHNIPYSLEKFVTYVPRFQSAKLTVDDKAIPCAPASFVSGKITQPNHLISSLTSSQNFLRVENINFNPLCVSISRSNHYFAPSLAIPRRYVSRLFGAQKVRGKVVVRKQQHNSANVLVGNISTPRYIVFSHYDSIYGGAVDNASGTALSLYLLIQQPTFLKNTLFVFAGNEELSYDAPIYWGHGYREFEKKHDSILRNVKKIFVLDCVGYSKTFFVSDYHTVVLGFPVKCLPEIAKKTYLVIGDYQKMMKFYHSDLDKPHLIDDRELERLVRKLTKMLIK